ncbi:hypothetical protein niasHT_003452 [Heterodera trifolii]|uniref:Uncharacterized protein n=1 Tax=Heterodera trifolii TaxID=157864 RepID=A0ABD2KVF4_9BILA
MELNKLSKDEQSLNNSIKDLGMEAWIQAYKKVSSVVQFIFDVRHNRFTLAINTKFIKRVKLSEQLAYILGFAPQTQFKKDKNPAKFMPDMSGGVSTLHVYIPDLIEPMMIGNIIAPIMRITIIRGNPDEVIEEQFYSVQYHRVLLKEVSEIFVEIRTSSGALMTFQYGTCTLTLHFRKSSYF